MKLFAICLILGASLMGCSSTPLSLPTCEIPAPLATVQPLLSVPEMPVEVSSTDTTATFDRDGIVQLTKLRKAALGNKEIGDLNAAALEARNEEVNQFIECSRYSKMWMEVREDMLEQERRDHTMDNLWHRGLIAVGVIAVSL